MKKIALTIFFTIAVLIIPRPHSEACSDAPSDPEKILETILRTAPSGIGMVENRVITMVNDYIVKLLGYAEEELLGKNARIFYPSDEDYNYVGDEKYRQISQRGTGSVETRWQTKDGKIINVILSSTPLDQKDLSKGAIFTVQDITEFKKAKDAVLESEIKFRTFFQNNPALMALSSVPDRRYIEVNRAFLETLGYTENEVIGSTAKDLGIFVNSGQVAEITEWLNIKESVYGVEMQIRRKDGIILDGLFTIDIVSMPEGKFYHTVMIDITQSKQAARMLDNRTRIFFSGAVGFISILGGLVLVLIGSLIRNKKTKLAQKESEAQFIDIFHSVHEGIAYVSLTGEVLKVNDALERILGIPKESLIGENSIQLARELVSADHFKKMLPFLKTLARKNETSSFQVNYKDKILEVTPSFSLTSKHFTGVFRDITERIQTERQIRQNLKEKEILLKEIHHRVKNNMAVVVSLLNLQAKRITNKAHALAAFEESCSRISAMAQVHEQLYLSDDFSAIDMKIYLENMIPKLREYSLSKNISITQQVDNVFLGIDYGIPCGLIINELVTNSFKHAFTEKDTGNIIIEFKHMKGIDYQLTVQDDGNALPPDIDITESNTLGLNLVRLLTEQIEGSLKINRLKKGKAFIIQFKIKKAPAKKGL